MHKPELKACLRIQVCMDEGRAFRILPSLAIQNVSGYGECPGKAEAVRTFSDEAIAGGNSFVSTKVLLILRNFKKFFEKNSNVYTKKG